MWFEIFSCQDDRLCETHRYIHTGQITVLAGTRGFSIGIANPGAVASLP